MNKREFNIMLFIPDLVRGATVQDLAFKHGLEIRSVYRYLVELEKAGYTIHKTGLSRWAPYKLMGEPKS